MSTTGKAIAQTALGVLAHVPSVPYKNGGRTMAGFDCQGFCTYCVEQNGGKAGWTDSNMLARKFIVGEPIPYSKVIPEPGMVGMILDPVGANTPARYKTDAFAAKWGDCSHVGIITMTGAVWSVDASASAGQVRGRTKREAQYCWTHAAKLVGISYDSDITPDTPAVTSSYPHSMIVNTDENGLTFRKEPRKISGVDNRIPAMPRIPKGATVTALSDNGQGWVNVTYGGYTGWVSTEFLSPFEQAFNDDAEKADYDGDPAYVTTRLSRAEVDTLRSIVDRLTDYV